MVRSSWQAERGGSSTACLWGGGGRGRGSRAQRHGSACAPRPLRAAPLRAGCLSAAPGTAGPPPAPGAEHSAAGGGPPGCRRRTGLRGTQGQTRVEHTVKAASGGAEEAPAPPTSTCVKVRVDRWAAWRARQLSVAAWTPGFRVSESLHSAITSMPMFLSFAVCAASQGVLVVVPRHRHARRNPAQRRQRAWRGCSKRRRSS